MLKRIDKEISGQTINGPDEIEAFLKSM